MDFDKIFEQVKKIVAKFKEYYYIKKGIGEKGGVVYSLPEPVDLGTIDNRKIVEQLKQYLTGTFTYCMVKHGASEKEYISNLIDILNYSLEGKSNLKKITKLFTKKSIKHKSCEIECEDSDNIYENVEKYLIKKTTSKVRNKYNDPLHPTAYLTDVMYTNEFTQNVRNVFNKYIEYIACELKINCDIFKSLNDIIDDKGKHTSISSMSTASTDMSLERPFGRRKISYKYY